MESKEFKYERENKGSLYNMGYTDGYSGHERDPHWYIDDGYGTGDKVNAISEEEINEYNQGYDDGKFHFNIDTKK